MISRILTGGVAYYNQRIVQRKLSAGNRNNSTPQWCTSWPVGRSISPGRLPALPVQTAHSPGCTGTVFWNHRTWPQI